MKTRLTFLLGFAFLISFLFLGLASAAETPVGNVCCEQTKATSEHGVLFCQNVPANECDPNSRQVPTSCESTSYCNPGYCYNSLEGTCLDNTPESVCNANEGTWSEEFPQQCTLGCCVLGDQAAFVSLVRCKRLSSFLGLQADYRQDITNEVQCVLEVQNQEKGACVYEFEFEDTCKYTTRSECSGGVNGTSIEGDFFPGRLCSAEEIGSICAPTRQTTCVSGKDEVYFVDSCGNPANIYDASKVDDKNYWSRVVNKNDACEGNPASCGNCNYIEGNFCRSTDHAEGNPTYGDNICADLNCEQTSNGNAYKHGESWCVYNDEGSVDEGDNAVGSRFYKHLCINGEEVVEQCADFRQEECIQGAIELPNGGEFSQAACRVNRWQDCTQQIDRLDCENTDRRDCLWKPGITFNASADGACVPKNSPGLEFWEGDATQNICNQASASCVVTFEKKLTGSQKCVGNCHCLTDDWTKDRSDLCVALGDCGPKINWIGDQGHKEGFKIERNKA